MGVLVYSATTTSTTLDEVTADKLISKGITSYSIDRCFIVNDCWRCMIIYDKSKTLSIDASCSETKPTTEELIILADKQMKLIAEQVTIVQPKIAYQEDKSFTKIEVDLSSTKAIPAEEELIK